MTDLHKTIIEIITAKPGQKAKDIAKQLGVDKRLVNSALYGPLKGKVFQGKDYRWYLKGSIDRGFATASSSISVDGEN